MNDLPATIRQVSQGIELMASEGKFQLPDHVPRKRFLRAAHQAVRKTYGLEKCSRASIYDACERAATDGLMLDGREASIVVRYQNGENVASYEPMYRGLLKLIRQSGQVSSIRARLIHANDHFVRHEGDDEHYEHRPVDLGQEKGDIIGAYAIAVLKDGEVVRELMDREALEEIRNRSSGWKAFVAKKIKTTPWATDFGEMARKTVLRRLSKYLPSSTDLPDSVDHDGDYEPDATIDHEEAGGAAELPEDRPAAPRRTKDAMKRATAASEPENEPEDAEVVEDDDADMEPPI